MKKRKMTKKEVSKVTQDINNVWHARFQGLKIGANRRQGGAIMAKP